MNEQDTSVPTHSDKLLAIGLLAAQLVGEIQQSYVNGEITQETYNKLYNKATEVAYRISALMAESEPLTRDVLDAAGDHQQE